MYLPTISILNNCPITMLDCQIDFKLGMMICDTFRHNIESEATL